MIVSSNVSRKMKPEFWRVFFLCPGRLEIKSIYMVYNVSISGYKQNLYIPLKKLSVVFEKSPSQKSDPEKL